MKRILMGASALMLMAAPAFASGNSGYAAAVGIAGALTSTGSTGSYGSIDGGGNTTNGKVYATSQSSNNEGAQQSFGLTGSQNSSYSTEQGSGFVNGNDKSDGTYSGGVDYAAGGNASAAGGYALDVAAYADEYKNTSSNW